VAFQSLPVDSIRRAQVSLLKSSSRSEPPRIFLLSILESLVSECPLAGSHSS
jgi:hypothetical protein